MRRAKFRPSVNASAARRTSVSAAKTETKPTPEATPINKQQQQQESPKKSADAEPPAPVNNETPKPESKPVATSARRRRSAAIPNLGRPRAKSTPKPQTSNEAETAKQNDVVVVDGPGLSDPPPVTRLADNFVRPGKSTGKSPSEKAQPKSLEKLTIPSTSTASTTAAVGRPPSTPLRDRFTEKRIVTPIIHDRRRDLKDIERDQETPAKRRKRYIKTQPPDRSKMTMSDLIYYNPKNNPMKSSLDSREKRKGQSGSEDEHVIGSLNNTGREDSEPNQSKNSADAIDEDQEEDEDGDTEMPVPQVRIGEDGTIVINEASLLVDASPKKTAKPSDSEIIYERSSYTTSASFKKRTHTATWTERETAKFYRALSTVGTDFTLINAMFPTRTRTEIKNKFKREEKINRVLVDKAIRERQHFDMSVFEQSESDIEAEKEKERKKKSKEVKKTTQRRKATKSKTDDGSQPEVSDADVGEKCEQSRADVSENLAEEKSDVVENGETKNVDESDIEKVVGSPTRGGHSDEGSDDEIQIMDILRKPTRSGRQPKLVKSFTIKEPPPRKKRQVREKLAEEKKGSGKKGNLLGTVRKESSDFSGYSPRAATRGQGNQQTAQTAGSTASVNQHAETSNREQSVEKHSAETTSKVGKTVTDQEAEKDLTVAATEPRSVTLQSYIQEGKVTFVSVPSAENSCPGTTITYIIPAGKLNTSVCGNENEEEEEAMDGKMISDSEQIECQIITSDEIPASCEFESEQEKPHCLLAETVITSPEYHIQAETYPDNGSVFIPPSHFKQTVGSAVTNVINVARADSDSD
ncbi:transcription factor TFIIIB component B'' homolog [Ptychodera flava]|uniref:transcription factor TFIIIB component B'' homolog n=1 Tax=Ptychodera flava TaxID=63121 RepID=UPI00396AAE41